MSLEQLHSDFTTISTFTDTYSSSTGSNSIMMDQTDAHNIPEWGKALWMVGFFCIWPPAIVLNLIVCWIIVADQTMRKKGTNLTLLMLAVFDLLTSIFNTPFNFYFMLHNDWTWSEKWCVWNQFLSNFFITMSVFTLTAISIDRYRGLAKPFASPHSTKRVIWAAVIWILSMLISSPILIYFDRFPVAPDSPKHQCMWNDDFRDEEHYYNVGFMGLTYFLPMIIMVCCYIRVCRQLWRTTVIGEEVEGDVSQRRLHEKRKEVVKMLIVVVILFAICWLPTQIYFIVMDFWPEWRKSAYAQYVYLFFYWLAMSNNMMNPLIYSIYFPNFRRRLIQDFRRCVAFCRCQCSQSDPAVGIHHGRGFPAAAYSRKNGLSLTGVTIETFTTSEMADDTGNKALGVK